MLGLGLSLASLLRKYFVYCLIHVKVLFKFNAILQYILSKMLTNFYKQKKNKIFPKVHLCGEESAIDIVNKLLDPIEEAPVEGFLNLFAFKQIIYLMNAAYFQDF